MNYDICSHFETIIDQSKITDARKIRTEIEQFFPDFIIHEH